MRKSSVRSIVVGVSLLALALTSARAADEPPGILWETTSQPVMEGTPVAMPAQSQQYCAAREWTRPPAGGDPSCTSSNFRRVGAKATWNVQCTGRMAMTGSGELTFADDGSYAGQIRFTGGQMPMTVKLTGKKIGTCDNPQ